MIFSHSRNAYIAKGKKILKVKDPVFKLLAISAFKLLAISAMYPERNSFREAAKVLLDLSEITSAELINTIECSFVGAYCYAVQKPVTVYNISKLPFVGTYRTAKLYCDLMVETGALKYTETGSIVITDKGNETSDFFFKALFEMPSLAEKMSLSEDVLIEGNRQAITLINKTLNGAEAGE